MSKQKKTKKKNPKHGVYSWLDQKRINPSIRGHRKIQSYLEDLESRLIEMQGGPDKITAAQEVLIKSTIEAYGVILLASVYCKDAGILRPDKQKQGVIELQPVLSKQFLAFMNTVRQNLLALGLDKKEAEDVLDLESYIKQRDAEEQASQDDKEGD